MISIGGKETLLVYWGKFLVKQIYLGYTLIWPKIKSCFGNGYWDNDQPWDGDDSWNNG